MEEWRDIKGYEGLYQVSNEGRVKSVDRVIETPNNIRNYKSKILVQTEKWCGYYEVSLYKNGKREHKSIHRLVAEAFIPNPQNKQCVDHINGIRNDNKVENLRWCTQQENNSFELAVEHQKNNPAKSKQVYQYTLDGNLVAIYPSTMEAERNGFYNTLISRCCLGKQETHKGYRWSYKPL